VEIKVARAAVVGTAAIIMVAATAARVAAIKAAVEIRAEEVVARGAEAGRT
jgi:hypothetical protein